MSKDLIRYDSTSSIGGNKIFDSSSSSGDSYSSSTYSSSSSSEGAIKDNIKFPFDFSKKTQKKEKKENKKFNISPFPSPRNSLSSISRNIFTPPYDSSWFETEGNLSIKKYLDKLFALSRKNFNTNVNPNSIKALIVPHAGIRYSGLCSATCYEPLLQRTKPIKRVILFVTHHKDSDNIITTSYTHIPPPFGTKSLTIDTKTISYIKDLVEINNEPFQEEHAFFNQLPFIEYVAPDAIIVPILISSSMIINKQTNSKLVGLMKTLRTIVDYKSNGVKPNENIIICTSDFSHVNGHFEHKITNTNLNDKIINNSIFYNIRIKDNEILQFVYDKINGVKTRCCKIDDTLFITNSPSCGAMAMYLFTIFMNMIYDNTYYSSSDSSNSSGTDSDNSSNSSNSSTKIKKLYTRIASYYTSPNKESFDIINTFNPQNLNKYIDLKPSTSSVSYEGIIFTTQPYLEIGKIRTLQNIITDYEKQCLKSYIKDYILSKGNLQTINTPVFKMNINVYIIAKDADNNPRYCISSFDKRKNDDTTLLSNIKMLIDIMTTSKSTYNNIIYEALSPREINGLEFEIYIMGSILPIELSEYYDSRFDLSSDLIMNKSKNTYEYLFAPMEKLLTSKTNKKQLFDKLLNLKDTDLQNKKYRMNNLEMFYIECLKI